MRSTTLLVTLLPLALSQTYSPGQACMGAVSYCAGGDIILHCGDSGTLYAGNCADNLDEPPCGATCSQSSPTAGDATCQVVSCGGSSSSSSTTTYTTTAAASSSTTSTTTTAAAFTPTPGPPNPTAVPFGPCVGNVAYCASGSDQSPIILRCGEGTSGILQPGNCDDNLDEPPLGALCLETSPTAGDAVCWAIGSPAPVFPSVSGSALPSTSSATAAVSSTTNTGVSTSAPVTVTTTAPISTGYVTSTVTANGTVTLSTTYSATATSSIAPFKGAAAAVVAGGEQVVGVVAGLLMLLGAL